MSRTPPEHCAGQDGPQQHPVVRVPRTASAAFEAHALESPGVGEAADHRSQDEAVDVHPARRSRRVFRHRDAHVMPADVLDEEMSVGHADQQDLCNHAVQRRGPMAQFVRNRDAETAAHGADRYGENQQVRQRQACCDPHRFHEQQRLQRQLQTRNPARKRRCRRLLARCRVPDGGVDQRDQHESDDATSATACRARPTAAG